MWGVMGHVWKGWQGHWEALAVEGEDEEALLTGLDAASPGFVMMVAESGSLSSPSLAPWV